MDQNIALNKARIESGWFLRFHRKALEDYGCSRPASTFKYGLQVIFPSRAVGADLAPFDNGRQPPTMVKTPAGVIGMPLSAAIYMKKYESLLREIFSAEDDRAASVAAWHKAYAGNGVLLHVPAGRKCDGPIRLDLALAEARRVENVIVIADEGSEVTVVERLSSAENAPAKATEGRVGAVRSAVTDIVAGPRAKVTHVSVQNFSAGVTDFSAKRARVAGGASVDWIECVFGADFAQSRVSTRLEGEGASSRAMAMFFAADSQKFDLRHEVRHLASRTTSDIRTRGAVGGRAKTVYRGLIRIEAGTSGCSGRQKEDTLMLGPDAEIDAMPDLEINAGDVSCGHSASAGRLDREKLFYLMSRGLTEVDARKMLIEGFFAPIVADMRDSGLDGMVNCLVANRLKIAV